MIDEHLERQYSPRAAVPEHPAFFARWATDSETVCSTLPCQIDLAYGDGDKETLDFFPAVNGDPASARTLVFIHGGYWRAFDKSSFSWIAPPFVQAGLNVAVLNYALCPAVTIAQIVAQCEQAVGWLWRTYRTPMLISGHSAGGHLTAMLYTADLTAQGVPPAAIVSGISLSGLFDLEPLIGTSMNADLRLNLVSARALSPIHVAPRLSVPLIAAVGGLESGEFRRQSHLLAEAWPSVCPPPLILDGLHHFSILDALVDLSSPIWATGLLYRR